MIDEDLFSKLTPSARDALNELSEQYKETILKKAFEAAAETDKSIKEISLVNVMTAAMATGVLSEKKVAAENKRKRLYELVFFAGLVYAVGGVVYYFYQKQGTLELGLQVAAIGVISALVAYFAGNFLVLSRTIQRPGSTRFKNFEIVEKWQKIESLAKKLILATEKMPVSSISINTILRFLSTAITADSVQSERIRALFLIRNKILHEQLELSEKQRSTFNLFADELIDRLEVKILDAAIQVQPLKIRSARYGTLRKSIDVTDLAIDLIQDNQLEIIANNETFSDPDPGTPKVLEISYEFQGNKIFKVFQEGDKVKIPD